jgi:signal transduction histidine kinase
VHDVAGHGFAVIAMQAGVALRVLDRDPAAAETALATVEDTGRTALTELRRLLGFLRDDAPAERAPQPSLADLGGLVAPTYVLLWGTFVPIAVLLFSSGRYGRGREPYLGAAVGVASMLGADLTVSLLQSPGEYVFHWTVMTLVWTAGWGLRRYADRAQAATEHAIRTEVAAAEQALRAVVDERTRIAREMHDIVGHALSAIVVQAGAAEQEAHDDPDATAHALSRIRATGSGALDEMRRLVAILREDDDSPRSPQPGVEGLSDLVGRTCHEGLRARLHREGEGRPLPAGMDLAVYRIVQEALTNVRRHSTATEVEVALRYGSDRLEVEVSDNGTPATSANGVGGHGLTGMRERVAMYGGALEAGNARQGFRVVATLPLAPAPA